MQVVIFFIPLCMWGEDPANMQEKATYTQYWSTSRPKGAI